MNAKITQGKRQLWQWDTGVQLMLFDIGTANEVHFATPDGVIRRDIVNNMCNIPDVVLQRAGTMVCYVFNREPYEGDTRHEFHFDVLPRPKPADYIDPPGEADYLDQLYDRLKDEIVGPPGPQGDQGPAGPEGLPGKDGVGISSLEQVRYTTADGGTNTWKATLTDGTYSLFNVTNGSKGSTGERGPAGLPGTSVSITSISESTEDDGYSVVTFSDGKTLRVKNGSKGSAGEGGGGVLWVNCTPSEDMQSFTADKSFEEVSTAAMSGQLVRASLFAGSISVPLVIIEEGTAVFTAIANMGGLNAVTLVMAENDANVMSIGPATTAEIVTITAEGETSGRADKTAGELYDAASVGLTVYADLMGAYVPAQFISENEAVFRAQIPGGTVVATVDYAGAVTLEIAPDTGAGGGGVLRVVVEQINLGEVVSTMTASEIFAAAEAGQQVECLAFVGNTANVFLRPAIITPEMVLFGGVYGSSVLGIKNQYCSVIVTNNTHTYSFSPLDKLPNPEPLTINGTSYDGSEAVNITADDLAAAVIAKLPRYGGETA